IGHSSQKGAQASIGGRGNCLKPLSPFPANAKFIVKATSGAGVAAAQLYSKEATARFRDTHGAAMSLPREGRRPRRGALLLSPRHAGHRFHPSEYGRRPRRDQEQARRPRSRQAPHRRQGAPRDDREHRAEASAEERDRAAHPEGLEGGPSEA